MICSLFHFKRSGLVIVRYLFQGNCHCSDHMQQLLYVPFCAPNFEANDAMKVRTAKLSFPSERGLLLQSAIVISNAT